MRYILFVIVFFVANSLCAQETKNQFTYKIYGGVNDTHIKVVRTDFKNYKYSDGIGWQAGIATEYQPLLFNYFLYINVGLKNFGYSRDTIYTSDTVLSYNLKPLFLDVPFGIGFRFPLKNTKYTFKVYGGINTLVGLGGKLQTLQLYYNNLNIDPNLPTGLQKRLLSETGLNFGDRNKKTFIFDYATTNWSLQLGTGIDLKRTAELSLFYNVGLTNVLPGRNITNEIQKLRVLELNLKIDFPNDVLNKHVAKK